MIFYSIIEIFNKIIGVLILAIIARSLSAETFAQYSIAMVVFSYFMEFSLFSFPTRNLVDYHSESDFIYNDVFASRQFVTLSLSLISFFIFNFFAFLYLDINAFPLSFVLLLGALNLDFILYGSGNGKLIVVSRFFSQLVFLGLIYLCSISVGVNENNIMFMQFFNSFALTILILIFAVEKCEFDIVRATKKMSIFKYTTEKYLTQISSQFKVFMSKIFLALIVTVELPLLLLFDNSAKDVFSVSYRFALIVLPFTIFFLNTNINSVSEKHLVSNSIFASIFSCVFVILSPVFIFLLFGEAYVKAADNYSIFFFIIPFQAIVNYVFYFALKNEFYFDFYKKMWVLFGFYCLVFVAVVFYLGVSTDLVAAFILFKVIFSLMSLKFFSLKTRIVSLIFVSLPLIVYYLVKFSTAIPYLNGMLLNVISNVR